MYFSTMGMRFVSGPEYHPKRLAWCSLCVIPVNQPNVTLGSATRNVLSEELIPPLTNYDCEYVNYNANEQLEALLHLRRPRAFLGPVSVAHV